MSHRSIACTGHCSNGPDDRYGLPASTMLCPPCEEVRKLRAARADERKHADELANALGDQLEMRAVKATAHPLVAAHVARRAKEAAE